MVVPKHGLKKNNQYGGLGIFDTIANLLMRMFTSSATKQIASSALNVGKEGAKKALEAGKTAAVDVGKKLVTKALTPKSKKILQKYTEPITQPATQDINTLIDGSAIEIEELVKKLNSGSGIKTVSRKNNFKLRNFFTYLKKKMNEKLEFNRENYEKYNTSRINIENGI